MSGLSPYATKVRDKVPDRAREGDPWGLCVHSSGVGPVGRAIQAVPFDPFSGLTFKQLVALCDKTRELLVSYYQGAKYSSHYAALWDGELHQVTDEERRVPHIGGVSNALRRAYFDGSWTHRYPPDLVARWRDRWPDRKSPQHLFPSRYPNSDYVGLELSPCGAYHGATFTPFAKPHKPGMRFTTVQHLIVVVLFADMSERWGWPRGAHRTSRLVGHEDVGLQDRTNRGGGWDPGALRAEPWFDWDFVLSWLDVVELTGRDVSAVESIIGAIAGTMQEGMQPA